MTELPLWIRTRTGRKYHLLDDATGTSACGELRTINPMAVWARGDETVPGYTFCTVCRSMIEDETTPDGPEAGPEYRVTYDAFGNSGMAAEERAPEDLGLE